MNKLLNEILIEHKTKNKNRYDKIFIKQSFISFKNS